TNSISDAIHSTRLRQRKQVNGRAYLNFNIIQGLSFENSLGLTYYHQKYLYQNSKFYGSSASTNGYTYQERTERFSYTLLNLLRRSEEHTSELQSRENLVCRLLLEKKNKNNVKLLIKQHTK